MRIHNGPACNKLLIWITKSLALAILYSALAASLTMAAISSSGDIAPVPPAGGGPVVGPFRIGNTDLGTMSIDGGTALTNSNTATLGETPTGVGVVTMSGLGSNWSMTSPGAPLTVGNFGIGSMSIANRAEMAVGGPVIVAAQNGSLGEISIDGTGSLMIASGGANIGQRGQALVSITDGGRILTALTIIGDEPLSDGRLVVSNPFSLYRAVSNVTVGDAGRGMMQVLGGARVENTIATIGMLPGSSGIVEVAGASSFWQNAGPLTVGDVGNGSLVVSDGGRVAIGSSPLAIGRQGGSTGKLEVRGPDSLLSAAVTQVGFSGDGTLRILNGGRVTSASANLGDNPPARANVLVEGAGSTWEVASQLFISDPGEAQLTISDGGLVRTSGPTFVAPLGRLTLAGGRLEAGASGLQNGGIVEGAGIIESAQVINVPGGRIQTGAGDQLQFTGAVNNASAINLLGGEMQFNLPVTNSAGVAAITARGGVLRFNGGMTNNGSVAVSFGTTDIFGDVNNSSSGQIVISGGSQATFYDDVVNNGAINVSGSGSIKSTAVFFGAVTGTGSFPGMGTVFLEGDLRPGASPAEVDFGGDLSLGANAHTVMEVGGAQVGSGHDQLDVAGVLAVNGALSVELIDGFAPQYGDAFDLFDFDRLIGQFDSIQLPALAADLAWRTDELYTSGTVAVVPEPGTAWLALVSCLVACFGVNRRFGRRSSCRRLLGVRA
jgi:T5SS/PEP-CTERM-associated repeat protein